MRAANRKKAIDDKTKVDEARLEELFADFEKNPAPL
jgi:hypothetical protein